MKRGGRKAVQRRLRAGRRRLRLLARRALAPLEAAAQRRELVRLLATKSNVFCVFNAGSKRTRDPLKGPEARKLLDALGVVRDPAYLRALCNVVTRHPPFQLGSLERGALARVRDACLEQASAIQDPSRRRNALARVERLFFLLEKYGYPCTRLFAQQF